MKVAILSLLFVCISYSVSASTKYDTIPRDEIPAKIQEIKNGTFKDSIFWSCVGLFDVLKYDFASLYAYKIHVSNQGLYFEITFRDKSKNISVSGLYFVPHFRKELAEDNQYLSSFWVPNEHFCRCTAKVGYAMLQKVDNSFTCVGAIPEYDIYDNLDIDCQSTETINIFTKKYYEIGLNRIPKITLIEPEILLHIEDTE